MRLADSAGLTDPGRKRRRNEDAFVVEPPLFAVADGMGGAQAGEVASRLATAALREFHGADDLEPAERVGAIIHEANRRIYERAQSDTRASGMGTTITAAILEGDRIAIGHVGDSRAYLLRDGSLEQLTQDHSLVADLMRSGRLTQEEAESHPQRSIITRALGTDREVEVDTLTVEGRPGDVVLLCSDGLTTMLDDAEILRLVEESEKLAAAGKALVKAANRSGGEDNVTVVLFRVEESNPADAAVSNGDGVKEDLEDTLSGLEPVATTPRAPVEDTAVLRTPPPAPAMPTAGVRRRRERDSRWSKRVGVAALAVAISVGVIAVAFWGLSRANFVGVDADGRLAVYQGLPWDLGGGVELYRERYVSQVQAVQLSAEERAELLDHDLAGYGEARARIRVYEEEGVP